MKENEDEMRQHFFIVNIFRHPKTRHVTKHFYILISGIIAMKSIEGCETSDLSCWEFD